MDNRVGRPEFATCRMAMNQHQPQPWNSSTIHRSVQVSVEYICARESSSAVRAARLWQGRAHESWAFPKKVGMQVIAENP